MDSVPSGFAVRFVCVCTYINVHMAVHMHACTRLHVCMCTMQYLIWKSSRTLPIAVAMGKFTLFHCQSTSAFTFPSAAPPSPPDTPITVQAQ